MKMALTDQMQYKTECKKHTDQTPIDNRFARDETPFEQFQRQKAKQLYQDQLLLIQMKKEAEKKQMEDDKNFRVMQTKVVKER
jgi:hypothetical protein